MSNIAAKFSSTKTRLQVSTAAVAVVAAATLTPAIADATPGFAPIAQGIGNSVDFSAPVVPGGLALNYAATAASDLSPVSGAAITDFNPFAFVFDNFVRPIVGWFYNALTFVANAIAVFFRVGPYDTSTTG
ncbi:hypothetical protein [Mycolicibacterium mengxianglii]|uniref:hypothetical protein n=1 Tax=Mycolicibacterium mengxianglii TaxID=2736649 RepID=UPI0018EF1528|nr:hypothetical protein [Mycolicibacterium mengxianglii]